MFAAEAGPGSDRAAEFRFVTRDRDSEFTSMFDAVFDAVFASESLRILRTPVRAPERMQSPNDGSTLSAANCWTGY